MSVTISFGAQDLEAYAVDQFVESVGEIYLLHSAMESNPQYGK